MTNTDDKELFVKLSSSNNKKFIIPRNINYHNWKITITKTTKKGGDSYIFRGAKTILIENEIFQDVTVTLYHGNNLKKHLIDFKKMLDEEVDEHL